MQGVTPPDDHRQIWSQRDAGSLNYHRACQLSIMPEKHRRSLSDAARRMQGATHHLIYKEYCLYPKFGHKIPLIINTSRITDAGNTTPSGNIHHYFTIKIMDAGCNTARRSPPDLEPEGCREPQLSSSLPTIHHTRETEPEQSGWDAAYIWSLNTSSGKTHHLGRYLSTSSSNNTFAASNSIPFLLLTFCPL